MSQFPFFDDVGSFPLPPHLPPEQYKVFYWDAYTTSLSQRPNERNSVNPVDLIHTIEEGFKAKFQTGLDIVTYPQYIDMYSQFLFPIQHYYDYLHPYLLPSTHAHLLEPKFLQNWAKTNFEQTHEPIRLKICVTGPLELYFKQFGYTVYPDLALNFAQSVHHFIEDGIIDTPYIKTEVVAIDEPSLGYVNLSEATEDDCISILDHSVEQIPCDVQIHIHSLNQVQIPLQSRWIQVITSEYASNPQNIVLKNDLDQADKFMRVGITRTNYNALLANALDKGENYEQLTNGIGGYDLIDSVDRIKHTLQTALEHYQDRLRYIGPDCGLAAWKPPEVASELLHRTAVAISEVKQQRCK